MILIVKTGSTLPNIGAIHGDFEEWFKEKMQLEKGEYQVYSSGSYDTFPSLQNYSGIVITGSPLMVTDMDVKGSKLGNWLLEQQRCGIPILGVCFGHQLLCVLNGGSIGYNLSGIEIGSAKTNLSQAGRSDQLLGEFPSSFEVYKSHRQSIARIPESAQILAVNDSGIIDAVKYDTNTWGVQFHPEFDADITKSYIQEKGIELIADGLNVEELLKAVVSVDFGSQLLVRFMEIVKRA
jgi:GMP synthase (glutamine-hydrolysing)